MFSDFRTKTDLERSIRGWGFVGDVSMTYQSVSKLMM